MKTLYTRTILTTLMASLMMSAGAINTDKAITIKSNRPVTIQLSPDQPNVLKINQMY